ncbi:hypothetical protein OROMI_016554 [Orobanche minor]
MKDRMLFVACIARYFVTSRVRAIDGSQWCSISSLLHLCAS